MPAPIERDVSVAVGLPAPAPLAYEALPEVELETPYLPRDHPPWLRDAVAISTRARELLTRMKPIAMRVLSFWDHAVRGITVAGRRLSVDASGSYRLGL